MIGRFERAKEWGRVGDDGGFVPVQALTEKMPPIFAADVDVAKRWAATYLDHPVEFQHGGES